MLQWAGELRVDPHPYSADELHKMREAFQDDSWQKVAHVKAASLSTFRVKEVTPDSVNPRKGKR